MGKLIIDEHGKLDLKSVDTLTKGELANWIESRLQGKTADGITDMRQGEPPHYLFALIYPDLDRDSRSYIRHIVRSFLNDMSRNVASSWRGEAAHSLLLLTQKLCEREFIAPIFEMASDKRFFAAPVAEPAENLHRRLLQSLVSLGWKGNVQFWREQFSLAPMRYAGVAFAGLSKIALQHAVNLLPDVSWSDLGVQDQMRMALRGLLPAHDHSVIAQVLADALPKLPGSVRGTILGFLPELSIGAFALLATAKASSSTTTGKSSRRRRNENPVPSLVTTFSKITAKDNIVLIKEMTYLANALGGTTIKPSSVEIATSDKFTFGGNTNTTPHSPEMQAIYDELTATINL